MDSVAALDTGVFGEAGGVDFSTNSLTGDGAVGGATVLAAEAAAAVWAAMAAAANLSINALCSAMRSSSGRGAAAVAAEARRGLALAICQKCV